MFSKFLNVSTELQNLWFCAQTTHFKKLCFICNIKLNTRKIKHPKSSHAMLAFSNCSNIWIPNIFNYIIHVLQAVVFLFSQMVHFPTRGFVNSTWFQQEDLLISTSPISYYCPRRFMLTIENPDPFFRGLQTQEIYDTTIDSQQFHFSVNCLGK